MPNQKTEKRIVEKIRKIFFIDNRFNKPIKHIVKSLGLYPIVYNILDMLGMHNEISMDIIKKLVNKNNPIILEIGANIGQDTKRFIKAFKKLKIYCFEPDPRAILQFKRAIDDPRCKLIEMAVSNRNGTIILHQSTGSKEFVAGKEKISEWTASSTIKKPINQSDFVKYKNNIKVKTIKLDDWVKENNISLIDFIWADVEGAEKDLILGGLKTLNEKTRYFYTEYSDAETYEDQPNLSEILKMLQNFKIIGIYGTNVLLKNKNFN